VKSRRNLRGAGIALTPSRRGVPNVASGTFLRPPRPISRRSSRPWWKRWFPLLVGLTLLALAPLLAYAG